MPPPEVVPQESINALELEGLGRAASFGAQGDAYAREHGQRPATIGLLLSTSPLALLIWSVVARCPLCLLLTADIRGN
jgi:microsomal epoxide hydrolase